jgi:hypothetical protein
MVTGGAGGIFQWGIFSQGLFTMGGAGGLVDSYNSATGPYNAATAGSEGDIVGNGSATLNAGSSVVKGDLTVVGTATGTSLVQGTVTQGASPFPTEPVLACPAGGYTPASAIPLTTGVTYDPVSGKLTVGGGNTLTLNAPLAQYRFSSMTLSGGSHLVINGGADQHVDIIIDDGLTVGGGGLVNSSGKPTNLAVSSCGSPTKPTKWDIGGGSGAYWTVYAPNHDVVVGGGGDLWGAVIGGTVSLTGGSKMHYDEALRNQAGSSLTSMAGGWAEFPQ